ncbi:MAG: hypothetical protein AAAC47_00345 [Pararhizobium sp.]
MERSALETRAKELGLHFDGRTSDANLKKAIDEAGHDAASSNPDQGARFGEPQGEARFIPVDDVPAEFKPNAEMDKIKQKKKASEKLFPVKLLKNYRPVSVEAQVQDEKTGEYRPLTEEESQKVRAGEHIALPVQEAKDVIANRIAERNDAIA